MYSCFGLLVSGFLNLFVCLCGFNLCFLLCKHSFCFVSRADNVFVGCIQACMFLYLYICMYDICCFCVLVFVWKACSVFAPCVRGFLCQFLLCLVYFVVCFIGLALYMPSRILMCFVVLCF